MTGLFSEDVSPYFKRDLLTFLPGRYKDWKKRLLANAGQLFENGTHRGKDPEAEIKELHAKIGELTMERDFLSEKLGR